jgi:UDP-N-acetyl-2-amino-2-deoxyglucuronate dehydrogenase
MGRPMQDADGISHAPTDAKWSVHRQDDNGNRFVVRTCVTRDEAERLVAEFEALGHKQLYWAEVSPD